MLKSVTIMNIPEGMKFSFNVLSNEADKESSKGFEGVGAGFNDEDAEPITPSMLTDEEKREEFSRLMAMVQPRINMPPLHGYSEDLDEDEDEDLGLSVIEPENLVDYQLIKSIIASNSKDALKLGVMVRTLAVQKLRTILENHEKIQHVFVFDREKDNYLTEVLTAKLYLSYCPFMDYTDVYNLKHAVLKMMYELSIYQDIEDLEDNPKVSDERFDEISSFVADNVRTLFRLDQLLNS